MTIMVSKDSAARRSEQSGSPGRRIPRGLIGGTAGGLAIAWFAYLLSPQTWPGRTGAVVQTVGYLGLAALTVANRTAKIGTIRLVQRHLLNPLFRALLALGLNPLGLAILETRGRVSGRPRRTPVGNGRQGAAFWIIAEHGTRANYVRNLQREPRVRVRLRLGLRYRWVSGTATVLPDDDPIARQRAIIRWHPLRILNAITVRTMGADLVTVRIALDLD